MSGVIKSVSYSQDEILQSILSLNGLDRFDADCTYGNGKFYGDIPPPDLKFDIDPQEDSVVRCDSGDMPIGDDSIDSLVFDPPFLTYVKQGRQHNSIMAKRFGGYWAYGDLADHYQSTIQEAARVLRKKGVLVVKCQDIIHNHKMHPTHINVVEWARPRFRLKDLFILAAKNRMVNKSVVQQHARIYHSYFLVLEKQT